MIWLTLLWIGLAHAQTSLHFQVTEVSQNHGPFRSPYESENSLRPTAESNSSFTWTVFAGWRPWKNTELYINPELVGGTGFSKTRGLAGFPNGEIYRVDDGAAKWSLSRLYWRQNFEFAGETEHLSDDANQVEREISVNRATVIAGHFSLNDFFDGNAFAHDPRTQFLNWAFMDNGAWDYAADTRGYTWGLFLEWNRKDWAIRFASVMVPREANQMELDKDFPRHRGDNLELEYRYGKDEHKGAVRLLAYRNTANMGRYRDALLNADVTQSRASREKYGFGLNLEQGLSDGFGVFARASWNDGETETWNFTEIDRALSFGASLKGARWKRPDDVLGAAYALNLLSPAHRDYFAAGGEGFMLGDGRLTYSAEQILETYYSAEVLKGLFLTGDYQLALNPAYNSDRGPVSIFSLRLHYEM